MKKRKKVLFGRGGNITLVSEFKFHMNPSTSFDTKKTFFIRKKFFHLDHPTTITIRD